MAAPKTVAAVRGFVAIDGVHYTVVTVGELRPASDPLVKANPTMFEPAKP
jgi:riboflavin synthase alpha subunit